MATPAQSALATPCGLNSGAFLHCGLADRYDELTRVVASLSRGPEHVALFSELSACTATTAAWHNASWGSRNRRLWQHWLQARWQRRAG